MAGSVLSMQNRTGAVIWATAKIDAVYVAVILLPSQRPTINQILKFVNRSKRLGRIKATEV
jgi:hypothetical protein